MQKTSHGQEHLSDKTSILDEEFVLKEHDVKMRYTTEHDATSIELF